MSSLSRLLEVSQHLDHLVIALMLEPEFFGCRLLYAWSDLKVCKANA